MRILPFVTKLCLCTLMVASVSPVLAEEADSGERAAVVFVQEGRPVSVHTVGDSWRKTSSGYGGNGQGQYLHANSSLGKGDFHIRSTVRIESLKESAASFILGDSEFVFEGPDGESLLRGSLAGKKAMKLGKPSRAMRAGHPVRFEVVREGGSVSFKIDHAEVVKVDAKPGPVGKLGFRPWRSHMTVMEFSVEGKTKLLPVDWEIPWVDLSQEKQRQTVVDRSTGNYLGHPHTVLLKDGKTILATYPLGHGGPAAVLRKSGDAGKSWSDQLKVPDNWSTATNCPTLHKLTGPDGVERLILMEGKGDMRQAISVNDGVTWTPLAANGLNCVVAPIQILPISGKRHLAIYQWKGRTNGSAVYQAISDDGGQTWHDQRIIADLAGASLCEPGPVVSADGKQIAVLIRENSRKYHSMLICSDDEGKTWSPLVEATSCLTGDRHIVRWTEDGRLVVTFRDMAPGSPTHGDFVAWIGKWEDLVSCREAGYRVRLLKNPGRWKDTGYAGLERMPDGTFVSTTYCPLAAGEKPSVVCVRFDVKELDARVAELVPHQEDLWVSGVGGYRTYRIPALITAADGTVLAFCEGRKDSHRDAGDIDLLLRRSKDNGKTWSPVQMVWDDGPNTTGNPCPVLDERTGRTWLSATRNLGQDIESKILAGESDGTRTVWMLYSDDHGATWSKPREITAEVKRDNWTWYATGPGNGIQLRSGRLVIPCDHVIAGTKQYCSHVIYSDDSGSSWKLGGIVEDRVNECQVVELADESLLLNMRSYHRVHRRVVARSTDGGLTFSKPWNDEALIEPVCQASILRYTLAGGKEERNRLLFLNPAATKRRNMTLRVSYDEGQTWPVERVLYAGPAAYSSLAVLTDGRIGCFYECGDKSANGCIRFESVDVRWLTNHTDSLTDSELKKLSKPVRPALITKE